MLIDLYVIEVVETIIIPKLLYNIFYVLRFRSTFLPINKKRSRGLAFSTFLYVQF